jgi:hypothetical protein
MKCQVDEIASWQMGSCQNDKLMKGASWQNGKLAK